MQKIVDICHDTFSEIGLSINLTKSHCIRIGPRHACPSKDILINGQPICWQSQTKFLGMYIKSGKMFECDWKNSKSNFYKAANSILSKLGSNPPLEVCLNLIRAQCLPVLNYGMCATSVSATDFNKLLFAYNSIFFKLFKCSSKEAIEYCQYYCNYWPLAIVIDYNRFCFLQKLYLTNKLNSVFAVDKSDYSDLQHLCVKYGLNIVDSNNCVRGKLWFFFEII